MESSDPDWPDVAALQGGEEAALDRLMERHGPAMLGFVNRMIRNAQDAEEIAQETFVRAYFQIQKYQPRAPFAAWLYQIARNLCRDYFRSRAYKQSLVFQAPDGHSGDALQPESRSSAEKDRIEAVQDALVKLPVKFRECLILRAIEGLSCAEAGARLGLTAKAVEVRAHRGRALLAKLLKDL
jgi:RNA polymerase sigma-70 factor (ECF subfamily)